MGYPADDTAVVARLVRHHLLLAETATTRDLGDPATARAVTDAVVDRDTLDLLEALTEADARATSAQAWTAWRAGLVHRLTAQVRSALAGEHPAVWQDEQPQVPVTVRRDPGHLHVVVDPIPDGVRVTVAGRDQPGFMAAVAGALALLRTSVRSARLTTDDGVAVSVWEVAEQRADVAVLAQRVGAVLAGVLDPGRRLRLRPPALPPSVHVHPEASQRSTVLELRTEDQPGVLWAVCEALTALGLDVRSAHVTTVGPQARDVFYVGQPEGGPLEGEQAAAAVHAVRRALGTAVTLDA
jgi:[protein-PII] uridylyltransferase